MTLRAVAEVVGTRFSFVNSTISERIQRGAGVARPRLADVAGHGVTVLRRKNRLTSLDLDAVEDVRLGEHDKSVDAVYRFLELVRPLVIVAVLQALGSEGTEQQRQEEIQHLKETCNVM